MTGPGRGFRIEGDDADYDVASTRRILEVIGVDAEEIETADTPETQPVAVEIYRIHPGGEESLCERLDPDDFVNGGGLVLVQRRHGGGKYRIRVRSQDGRSIKTKTKRVEDLPAGAAPAAADVAGSRIERLLERLLEQRGGGGMPPGFMEAVSSIAAANAQAQATLVAPLLAALTQKDSRGDATERVLDALLRGVELGKETASAGEGFGATVRELLPGALRALQQLPTGGEAVNPSSTRTPAAPPVALPDPNLPAWARVLAPRVPDLVSLAGMRADVDYWAERIVDDVDGERLTFIEDQLHRGAPFREDFFRVFPATMEHRSWFERLFDSLAAELAELRAADADDGRTDDAET